MALDKLVDSAQLEADLTTVADAIREKGGTSASLSFPSGMAQAIEDLPEGEATMPYIEETYTSGSFSLTGVVFHGRYDKIRAHMFEGCGNLRNIQIPDEVKEIGDRAFVNCTCSDLSITSLPSGLVTIGEEAFKTTSTVLQITRLPATLQHIKENAFYSCYGLTSITFESTPITLHNKAFNFCSNITTINVPWAEGAVANAPWGATNATINYNYTGE